MKQIFLFSALCGCAFSAHAEIIDFSGLSNGEVLAEQYASIGVHISATDTDHQQAVPTVFDMTSRHGDDDLNGLFETGNIPLDTQLGNILVYQHDEFDFRSDDSDDQGGHQSQKLIFDFDFGVQSFGFIAMGFDDDLGEHSSVEFFREGVSVEQITFDEFSAGGMYDFGALFGDHSINEIGEFSIAGGFDRVEFSIGDSIGLDNVSFTVPTPGTVIALSLVAGIGIRRRR